MSPLLLVVGCARPADVSGLVVEAEVSDVVATAVTVRWRTDQARVGYVEFGPDLDYGLRTPERAADTEHEEVLVGLLADATAHYRVVVDGEPGADHTITTGTLPLDLPATTVTGVGLEGWLVTSFVGAVCGPAILDPQGNVVWYYVDDTKYRFCTRARLSRDGRSVLYGVMGAYEGSLFRVSLDGRTRELLDAPAWSHDFVEHEDGTIAYIGKVERESQGGHGVSRAHTDRILELDPEGETVEIWRSEDWFDPSFGEEAPAGRESPTHANALDYDETQDRYYLGLRDVSTILGVNRANGDVAWALGGELATIDYAPDTAPMDHQHQFELLDDGLLVFDNHNASETASRAVEYALSGGQATEVWSYVPVPNITAYALGDVHRLDDGMTLVDWSSAGQMDLVSPSGAIHWRLNNEIGVAFGYVTLVDALYPEDGR